MNEPRSHRRNEGFTLVEMLVAIVLLAVGILAVMRVVSASTAASAQARDSVLAASLAQGEMNELIHTADLSTGSNSGDFGTDYPTYRWESDVETSSAADGLWDATVTVYWKNGHAEKRFDLVTMIPDPTAATTTTSGSNSGTTTGGTTGGNGG